MDNRERPEKLKLFRFKNKMIRTIVLLKHFEKNNIKHALCFSCGNASAEIEEQLKGSYLNVEFLNISPQGDLIPNRWFSQAEIKRKWPEYFDATSGHLSMELMYEIGQKMKFYLGDIKEKFGDEINLPTGSGETLVCLKMAYPDLKINAVYNLDAATEFSNEAPLNRLVELLANKIYK